MANGRAQCWGEFNMELRRTKLMVDNWATTSGAVHRHRARLPFQLIKAGAQQAPDVSK